LKKPKERGKKLPTIKKEINKIFRNYKKRKQKIKIKNIKNKREKRKKPYQ
jgi:hypothetical protein